MKKLLAVLLTGVMCMGLTSCDNEKEDVDDEEEIVEHDVDDEENDDEDDTSDKSYKEKDEKKSVDSDWEYIKDKGVINVGVTDFYPLNYRDSNGEWTGFDTEFAQAVGKKLGIDVEFVEISWDEKETELASKNIDCIWNGLVLTDERKETMALTKSYAVDLQVLVMVKDRLNSYRSIDDLSGLTLVAEWGSSAEQIVTGAGYECRSVANTEEALRAVSANEADACVVDIISAKPLIGRGKAYENLASGFVLQEEFFVVGFRKDSDAVKKVNTVIDEMKSDGSLKALADKYGVIAVK